MSKKTVAQKLFIRENYAVLLINAPKGYKEALGVLPAGARIVARASRPVELVLVFATSKAELTALLLKVKPLLKVDGLLWAAYPKAGQMGTDLKREVVRDCGQEAGMETVAQIAIDDVWSALRLKAE